METQVTQEKMEAQVTLSRAHKVAERLKLLMAEQSRDAVSNLSDTTITGLTGTAQVAALNERTAKGLAAAAAFARYNEALGELRAVIGRANASHGVNELLTQQETLSRQVGLLQGIIGGARDPNAVLPSQLAEYKPLVVVERSLREPNVRVTMLTPDALKALEAQLAETKKLIFVISDKVADANAAKIKVKLPADLAGLLGLV